MQLTTQRLQLDDASNKLLKRHTSADVSKSNDKSTERCVADLEALKLKSNAMSSFKKAGKYRAYLRCFTTIFQCFSKFEAAETSGSVAVFLLEEGLQSR